MDKKDIVEIIDQFSKKQLSKLTIKKEDFSLEMEKEISQPKVVKTVEQGEVLEEALPEEEHYPVKSPLAGVYYEAPSPESDPFVKVGDSVDKDQVVCIVEAMKMINEIKAPVAGTIKKINFTNEDLVQYDDTIMEIEENV